MHTQMSDAELIELLRQDDQAAMREIFERYWKKLFSVALNRLAVPEQAEECVLDVLISVWERRNNLSLKHTLATYLAVAVKYRAIRILAKEYQKGLQNTVELKAYELYGYDVSSVDEYILEKELMETLETAVKQLPEKCRLIYRMSSEQGMSYKEIAEKLNLSEKTVQAHLTKATKTLRSDLRKQYPTFLISVVITSLHQLL
ncbi:RNA polymerase sigma-70 factor [Olivibacter sp. 47]|uniref:RNA polymerase sigma-70 factor n=1 Tax=Olivibacter sp. 47 TaxID=3056486 RepID=UPI0025A323CA|nr:RNA polymerase sigma-70 factor [Olivibacter sp. 47]MDM8177427.1 RNA polymerase sigma-70 factor [Olivibacter sp. 47]